LFSFVAAMSRGRAVLVDGVGPLGDRVGAAGVEDPGGGDLLVAEDPAERLVALGVGQPAEGVVQLPGDPVEADELARGVVELDPERFISFLAITTATSARSACRAARCRPGRRGHPVEASSAMTPVVSSMEIPIWWATGPTYFSAVAKSVTSPCADAAPSASRSAMCGMSLPARPNWFIAVAAMSAACRDVELAG
jgi:hypothetical protein